MQNSGAFPSPASQSLYQFPYHPAPVGPQDHDLKKQYLALLPPQQIIEICLNFDLHVPHYVRSTVWPVDISAAIAAMQNTSSTTADPPRTSLTDAPAMSSLSDLSPNVVRPTEPQSESQPPDRDATPNPPTQPLLAGQATPTSQSPYPHQPYGHTHTQPAHPHTPYYQHGYPTYPSMYPHYLQIPNAYPPPPGYPSQANPPFTNTPQQRGSFTNNNTHSTDDLPGYEEMIVEALTDLADPEGCAPKDIFMWMASKYPLQSNFRPSASQALQKAFKRRRFEKSSGGKYKLNASWEGGITSRRTTRRPQTQNQAIAPPPAPASPFTHAPLIHHPHPQSAPPNHTNQTFGFSYQQPLPGYSGYPQQPQPQPQAAIPVIHVGEDAQRPQMDHDANDAYEAAQNILKAINFGGLLQLPAEEGNKVGDEPPRETVITTSGSLPSTTTEHISESEANPKTDASETHPSGNNRAELQAQLALLAAQLAELAQEEDDDVAVPHPPPVSDPPALTPSVPPAAEVIATNVPVHSPSGSPRHSPAVVEQEEEEEEGSDDDMEEVM